MSLAFPFWQLEPALAPGHSSAARGTALAGASAASCRHPPHTLLINPLDEANELLIPFPSDHPEHLSGAHRQDSGRSGELGVPWGSQEQGENRAAITYK